MIAPEIQSADTLCEARTQEIVERFYQEGYALVPDVLGREEVVALREAADRIFADPKEMEEHKHGFDFVASRLYAGHPIFSAMLAREPIHSLVEAILGPGCEAVGQNVIRNPPSVAISRWHVDDVLECPLPEEIARHDARIRLPVLWLSVQIPLSDLEAEKYGPGQFIPGSHYSGRMPPPNEEAPTFEGRGPVSVLCKAGDIYLFSHQCWHRGAPNSSDRTRYILQQQYGKRWAIRRFSGVA